MRTERSVFEEQADYGRELFVPRAALRTGMEKQASLILFSRCLTEDLAAVDGWGKLVGLLLGGAEQQLALGVELPIAF